MIKRYSIVVSINCIVEKIRAIPQHWSMFSYAFIDMGQPDNVEKQWL